jgi:hypothetical protein
MAKVGNFIENKIDQELSIWWLSMVLINVRISCIYFFSLARQVRINMEAPLVPLISNRKIRWFKFMINTHGDGQYSYFYIIFYRCP